MNIFVLDYDIKKCAEYHCDRHVVKMVLEYAQILSTVSREFVDYGWLYKSTHKNHPATIWTRESKENFLWLIELGLELSKEYTRRYNKFHKSGDIIRQIANICDKIKLEPKGLTDFALCMPDEYKVKSSVKSYRNYYLNNKKEIAKWNYGKIPYWWKWEKI